MQACVQWQVAMALKMLVKCIMREGPPKCRCSASTSSGPGVFLEVNDSLALATSPGDTVMSSSGGMVSRCLNSSVMVDWKVSSKQEDGVGEARSWK